MRFIIILAITAFVMSAIAGVAAIVKGAWLSTLLFDLNQWEVHLLGTSTLAALLNWIIAISILFFIVRLLTHLFK